MQENKSALDGLITALSRDEKNLLKLAILLLQIEAEKDNTSAAGVLARVCGRAYTRVCHAEKWAGV